MARPRKTSRPKSEAVKRSMGADRTIRRLTAETLERRLLLTTVTSVDPLAGERAAPVSTNVSATFSADVAAANDQNFVVHSTQRGQLVGGATTVSTTGPVATHNPTNDFLAGERVQATVTGGLATAGGPQVWQFRTAVRGGLGTFADSGQSLGIAAQNNRNLGVALGDLDGDGDLDAFMSSYRYRASQVFLNDGGTFSDSGQALGQHDTTAVALGDVDGDGDLDAVVSNAGSQGNLVWQNNGNGMFTAAATFGNQNSRQIALGDLDGDGDLDVFTANTNYQGNQVYLNNGSGAFSASGSSLGNHNSRGVDLGDVDGDGDLDAFVANGGAGTLHANRLLLNDGNGMFTDSGQGFGSEPSERVEFGDLDGDGDLDVFVTSFDEYNNAYLNDGNGVLTNTGQTIGSTVGCCESRRSLDVELGDVDADGDLDAFVANSLVQGNRVYLNNGAAEFTDSGQTLPGPQSGNTYALALGDVDGDGDLDAVTANDNNVNNQFSVGRVWINQNPANAVTLSVDSESISEEAGVATVTATLSAAAGQEVVVSLGFSGTATAPDDYTASAAQIAIAAGTLTGSVTINAVADSNDEPDETVVIDISGVTNASEDGVQQVTVTIVDDDEPIQPDVTLTVDNAEIAEGGDTATLTIVLSEATTVPVTVELGITGTAAPGDFTASASSVVITPGATSETVTVTAVQDDVDEPDETVIVDIADVTGGNETGEQQQTITILDDDIPPSFAVTLLETSASGLRLEFASPLDGSEINLFDTQNANQGPADLTVTGAASGPVSGSLVMEESAVMFIKSGDPLATDTYTVSLRSADNGFKDTTGALLDGNGDGTAGDDYVAEFSVGEAPVGVRTIQLPDFVRGPGQPVNLPANVTTGIPIAISDGDNVRAVDLRINYDPSLLQITDATAPGGGTVVLNTNTPGLAILVYFNSSSLPAGESTIINLEAAVPVDNASEIYGTLQILDVHGVIVGDGNDNEFPVAVDDAVHLATFFSDVSGNGRTNAADASQVARFAALIDSGFAGSLNTDPNVAGDISGNGRINAGDASLVARFSALIPVDQIPPIPSGALIAGVPLVAHDATLDVPTAATDQGDSATNAEGSRHGSSNFGVVEPVPLPSWGAAESLGNRLTDGAFADQETLVQTLEEAVSELFENQGP